MAGRIPNSLTPNNKLFDQSVVQQDWEDREFDEMVQLSIAKTVSFINEFDSLVRAKLSDMNQKLFRLERSVQFCEAAIKSTQDRVKGLSSST